MVKLFCSVDSGDAVRSLSVSQQVLMGVFPDLQQCMRNPVDISQLLYT